MAILSEGGKMIICNNCGKILTKIKNNNNDFHFCNEKCKDKYRLDIIERIRITQFYNY